MKREHRSNSGIKADLASAKRSSLIRSLGEDAKRTWTKYKTFEAFLA